jgi:phage-related protein
MSEALFYNRDTNISGVAVPAELSDLSLTPVYGSRVEFQGTNHSYITDDFYYNLIPLSINSLGAKFSLRYDVNEANAKSLISFFESQSGHLPIKFAPDNGGIYKTVSGVCDNYAVNFINNQHFEVAASLSVDHAPTFLNWSGGNFANVPFQNWASTESYKKYDVTYFRFNEDGNLNGKLDSFYYCSGDHTSSETNSPTGTASMWSQKFFFEPDIGTQNDVQIKADVLNYKNSFTQRLKTNDNIATFNMSYTYSNISDLQLKSMLHFLENKGGYRRFEHQIPSVYNRPKVYYCPSWTHTWTSFNSNNLTVELVEDPLGVIPTSTFPWNVDAEAYFTEVEAHPTDPYTFTAVQKAALSDFFDALDTEGLSSKIKKMWLVGFSVAAGLRDVMNPTEVETWDIPPVAGDMHDGYATFSTEKLITTSSVESLGLEKNDCGAFVTCTNMDDDATINYVNGYASSSKTFKLSQRKHTSGPPEEWEPWFRAGSSTYTKFRGGDFGTDGIHNGVFLASRKGDGVGDYVLTRIKGERVLEEGVDDVVAVGQTSDAAIILWGGTTVGNVSSVGITSGLTETESATLAGLIYDLCVGIGHTDLENTT